MTKFTRLSVVFLSCLALAFLAAPSALASPNAINLPKITSTFNDWDGTYNEFLDSWTFLKYSSSDSGDDVESLFYIDSISDEDAGTINDYTTNLKKKDWLDFLSVWTEITSTEKLADGFLIIGKSVDYKDSSAKPGPCFVMVRKFKNTSIRCRGSTANAGLLQEAIGFCRALQ